MDCPQMRGVPRGICAGRSDIRMSHQLLKLQSIDTSVEHPASEKGAKTVDRRAFWQSDLRALRQALDHPANRRGCQCRAPVARREPAEKCTLALAAQQEVAAQRRRRLRAPEHGSPPAAAATYPGGSLLKVHTG